MLHLLPLAAASFVAYAPTVRPHQQRAQSPPSMIFAPALFTAASAVALSGFKIVGTSEAQLIERLGKYDRQLEPGLHYAIPIIERTSFRCTTREQVLDCLLYTSPSPRD